MVQNVHGAEPCDGSCGFIGRDGVLCVSFLCDKIPEKSNLKKLQFQRFWSMVSCLCCFWDLLCTVKGACRLRGLLTVVAGTRSGYISRECQQGTPFARNTEGWSSCPAT